MRSSKDALDEEFSRLDDIRERYHREIEDIKHEGLVEQEWHEYMNKVWAAGYGEDVDAYEAYWKRTLEYYETRSD